MPYKELESILREAYNQATEGKGKERHARGMPFDQQPISLIPIMVGPGFLSGQAIKKIVEAQYLPVDKAVHELQGAINYLAKLIQFRRANHACNNASCSCAAHRPGEGGE